MIELISGDWRLLVAPETGGSIASAQWRGVHVLRPLKQGGEVLDVASFPLAPFSNRIANSRIDWRAETIELEPNHTGDPDCVAIHGFAWLEAWDVSGSGEDWLELRLEHAADETWPWSVDLRQRFELHPDGVSNSLSLKNCDSRAMPAGLGFHPYFPRFGDTIYRGFHRGEWQIDEACLPVSLNNAAAAEDWWSGRPVGERLVDTVYTERQGPLIIEWPNRKIGLRVLPSPDLDFTTVYVPPHDDFFCVEPVSHMTDAFNRSGPATGTRVLEPGAEWTVCMELSAFEI